MSSQVVQIARACDVGDFGSRCRVLGVPLLSVGMDGEIVGRCVDSELWASGVVVGSTALSVSVREHIGEWREARSALLSEAWPGCWLLAMGISEGRRRVGFKVAVFFTGEVLECEQFHRVCDDAEVDWAVMCQRMAGEGLLSNDEVSRYAMMLSWMADDVGRWNVHDSDIDSLSVRLSEVYEEISLFHKLSAQMTVNQDPRILLEKVCEEILETIGLTWIGVYMVDGDEGHRVLGGELTAAGALPCPEKKMTEIGHELLYSYLKKGGQFVVDDVGVLGVDGLDKLAKSMLIYPMMRESKPMGLFFGADKTDGMEFDSVDSKLVVSLAQNVSVFLDNVSLYDDLRNMFMGTLRSLVSAIDAKDTYTRGHSERVAWLSRELGRVAGLNKKSVERVHLAALVHDVGKIGIPDWVLTKPGRLTDEEFGMIKAHPRIGLQILRDIRQMHDLLPGVLHHHEKYDGSGYPDGLSGEDIPLYARVVALADSFDAMSSDRTYRRALPRSEVMAEIRRCAGKQFDPDLAAVFSDIDFTEFDELIQKDHGRCSQLRQALGECDEYNA